MPIVECIPNFSEGRRETVIKKIMDAIRSEDVNVIWHDADPDHNRMVVTFAGQPKKVVNAAFNATKTAANLIDMDEHRGEHPRIGATDVIPFIPIKNAAMEDCVTLAEKLGEQIASQLSIPVYLYAEAAKKERRKKLANIRRGEYEKLKTAIEEDPSRKPDFGPAKLSSAGATVVGAREQDLAINFFLNTNNKDIADRIAKEIRGSSGGFRGVKALGFRIKQRGCVQVSTMIKPDKIDVHKVFESVKNEAKRYGTSVVETELYGVTPLEPILKAAKHYLRLNNFSDNQILEKAFMEE